VAEREASGDFDYFFDDPADADGLTGHAFDSEAPPELDYQSTNLDDDLWDDPDDNFWDRDPESADDHHFDAFDTNTWYFAPAPTPWYRTKPAMAASIAAATAMAAIVVAGVLLVFRSPGNTDDATTSVTPTAPTSATRSATPSATTSAAPPTVASRTELPPPAPPPPPVLPPAPPPPAETLAPPVNTAPDANFPRVPPRANKPPEIGVTRTPATRSPISVAPQPRSPRS
jgi:hypothetical protein